MNRITRVWRYLACALFVTLLIAFCFGAAHVNATTAALGMLLLVLAIASRWTLGEALFTSVLCVLGFNYFFLPPIGTFTIADPQNWIALAAFVVSAIGASQLSAQAKNRAEEASARRREIERLYRLSRAMLMRESRDLSPTALAPLLDIFELKQVMFYDVESGEVRAAGNGPVSLSEVVQAAQREEETVHGEVAIRPVRLGTRVIGSVALAGPPLTAPERESIANLIAIEFERTRAQQRAASAEAAREGERLKRFVLDGIAHDLKTPLTAIKTCVTTLLTIAPQSEEKRRELLSIVDEETERLHRTVSEAIELARIESGKITLQRERLNVAEQFERLVTGLADAERFRPRIEDDLEVVADPELLRQALRQLVENARKYAPTGSEIELIAAKRDGHALLQVLDRGPGISPPELERIFEKFYRGTRGCSSTEGTGMGLAIAKGIIEAHGGRIWAENRPGGGAAFLVELANER